MPSPSAQHGRDAVAALLRPLPDEGRPLGAVFRREQPVIVKLHVRRVRHIAEGVGKGQLHGLDLPVEGLHALPPGEVEVAQDVQGHQGRDALAVGGNLAARIAPVIHGDGLHPAGLMGRQVLIEPNQRLQNHRTTSSLWSGGTSRTPSRRMPRKNRGVMFSGSE